MPFDIYGTYHDTCTEGLDPDSCSPAGRVIAIRGIHACLTYLLHEAEALSPELASSIHSAISAAEDVMQQQPDMRN